MNRKFELLEHLSNNTKIYELKIGDINVEMSYSKSKKKIEECMLNILKQKSKLG